ncbi:MAG TPA: hypothetical protein VGO52_26485 [Hyphomonadaceae bacterium]|jgi:hypothetical protein|nr:hypothetical protein [Hyphomonadaceae bacterium]
MEGRPTPDPGATEALKGEPDYAAARRHLKQNAIPENDGLTSEDKRSPAHASNVEGTESDKAREAAAQRGRAAN